MATSGWETQMSAGMGGADGRRARGCEEWREWESEGYINDGIFYPMNPRGSDLMEREESRASEMSSKRSQQIERRLEWANGKTDGGRRGNKYRSGEDRGEHLEEGRRECPDEDRGRRGVEKEDGSVRSEDVTGSVSVKRSTGSSEVMDGENRVKTSEELSPLNSFGELSSHGLVSALSKEYSGLTVIQRYCIPPIIEGRNLICRAPTGMGKTMCFLIPIVERYKPRSKPQACIVSPTRELCEQIRVESMKLVHGTRIRVVSIYGKKQELSSYAGVDVVVATPGRLMDLLSRGRIDFSEIKMFVLDEADKLLDMGFEIPIKEIRNYIPLNVQTCLFSATYSPKLTRVINYFLPGDKVSIEMVSETLSNIRQEIVEVHNKKNSLLNILRSKEINLKGSWRSETQPDKVLVFVERKSECGEVEKMLKRNGVACVSLHGDKEQNDRNEALKGFREGMFPVMVATSVAARGIDVKDIKLVINYDIPKDIKEYIHRIGRTGREGKRGRSISFYDSSVSKEMRRSLIDVLKESKNKVPGFLSDTAEDFNERFERLKITADKEASDNEEVGLW